MRRFWRYRYDLVGLPIACGLSFGFVCSHRWPIFNTKKRIGNIPSSAYLSRSSRLCLPLRLVDSVALQ